MEFVIKYKLTGWEWEAEYKAYEFNRQKAIDKFLNEIQADLDRLEYFRIRAYKI